MTQNFNLQALQQHFEAQLDHYFPKANTFPPRLHEAMRYMMLGKAKRIRPLLVYATGACWNIPRNLLDLAAIAIECMHTYSLVHDDLPAMDNDDLRRGKPTCHKAYDEATAILVGDALQNLAFELLSKPQPYLSASQQLQMLALLAQASGSQGMIGGQMLDMQYQGQKIALADIEKMHALKTGALIHASVMLPTIIAECTAQEKILLEHFANTIGLAFQIKDDILDVESNTAILGKTSGNDDKQQKASTLSALNLKEAKTRTEILFKQACVDLAQLTKNTIPLKIMAEFIIQRHF